MLASIGDYLQAWEAYELFPILAVVLFVWLVGGGYLFQKILGKRTDRRKYPLKHGILVSLLCGAGGVVSALALYFIVKTIVPVKPGPDAIPINWFGVVLGAIGYFTVSYLIVFSMDKLSAKETLQASFVPIITPVLVGVLVVGPSFYLLSYKRVQAERSRQRLIYDTAVLMNKVYNALEKRKLQTGRSASSLEELVTENYLEPKDIRSPANPKGRGFFFNGDSTTTVSSSRKILLCDYEENFGDKGRTVLYCGGYPEFLSRASFQARLQEAENRKFAQALEAAEKK